MTALGLHAGIRATLGEATGSDKLSGRTIAIQGLGQVGRALAQLLHRDNARLIVTDLDSSIVESVAAATGANPVGVDDILAVECDVLSPCALGGVINKDTRSRLRTRIVAGAANNVLATPADGAALAAAGILYAPDYVINAGGMIWEAAAVAGWDYDTTISRVLEIGDTLRVVFRNARARGTNPVAAADQLAHAQLTDID